MGIKYLEVIQKSGQTWPILQEVWGIASIAIPIIIIVLSTVDFVIAIARDDEHQKKALNKLVKRLVFAVLFFLLPVILNLLFSWTDIGSTGM